MGHRKLAGEQNNFFIEECNGNCLLGNPANYAQRLTIKPGGNVGIGTMNPTAKLDIAGGIKVGDTSTCTPGTIRFRGGDFEGCVGGATWKSLTTSASAPSGPQLYQCPNLPGGTGPHSNGSCFNSCVGQVQTTSSCVTYNYNASIEVPTCVPDSESCSAI
jgi:hypothetical protein